MNNIFTIFVAAVLAVSAASNVQAADVQILKGTSINCFYHGVYECNLLKLINTNFSKLNY